MSEAREKLRRLLDELRPADPDPGGCESSQAPEPEGAVDLSSLVEQAAPKKTRWWLSLLTFAPLLLAGVGFGMAGGTLLERMRAGERLDAALQSEKEEARKREDNLASRMQKLEAELVKTQREKDDLLAILQDHKATTARTKERLKSLEGKNEELQGQAKKQQHEIQALNEKVKLTPERSVGFVLDEMSEFEGKLDRVGKDSLTVYTAAKGEKRMEFKITEQTQIRMYGKPVKPIDLAGLKEGVPIHVYTARKLQAVAVGISVGPKAPSN